MSKIIKKARIWWLGIGMQRELIDPMSLMDQLFDKCIVFIF